MADKKLEIVELEPEDGEGEPFSTGRLLTVATVGALLSLGAYYIYHQLDDEKRRALKSTASSLVAEQIHRLTEVDD